MCIRDSDRPAGRLSPRIARALDAARGVARARDALFTAEGSARVAPEEMRACSSPEERLVLAEALVESAATSRPPPAGAFAAGKETRRVSSGDLRDGDSSTVVVLAGAVEVQTLAEEDASDPDAPADGTPPEDARAKRRSSLRRSKSGAKENKNASTSTSTAAAPSDARSPSDPPSPVYGTCRVLSVETFAANDVFELRGNQRSTQMERMA